jgi:hypothetical protein
MKNNIKKLKEINRFNQYSSNNEKTITEIRDFIKKSDILADKKKKALSTIDAINKDNTKIVETGMSEKDILALVWNRMHSRDNKRNMENLKESLIYQLNDCQVDNVPVCPSGRMARIISSLNFVDANPELGHLKPKWAVKEELNTVAAKIRDRILQESSSEEKQAYLSLTPSATGEKITDKIKKEIEITVHKDYQVPGIMTDKEVKDELKPILESV